MSLNAVTDSTFDAQVFCSPIPVVVDFWGPWCTPCLEMEPMLERAAEGLEGKVSFLKLDVSLNHRITGSFGIMQVPTLIFFHEGQPVTQMGKPRSYEALMQTIIERLLPANTVC